MGSLGAGFCFHMLLSFPIHYWYFINPRMHLEFVSYPWFDFLIFFCHIEHIKRGILMDGGR